MKITKAVIPAAGLGTRFLPLSKAVPKELIPLGDLPIIDYATEEARQSGIEDIIFVISDIKKAIQSYFSEDKQLEQILSSRNPKSKQILERLREHLERFRALSFSYALQKVPRGDGDAVLRARRRVGKNPFAVLFPDDIFMAKVPVISQLSHMFQSSGKVVIGLMKVSAEKVPSYGTVAVERIANKLYKVKGIQEKAPIEKASSDLAIVGRYVLTPDIFEYLNKTAPNHKDEIILADAINLMVKDGKVVYGAEIKGDWLECGDMEKWLRSFFCLTIRHPDYGAKLRKFLKEEL